MKKALVLIAMFAAMGAMAETAVLSTAYGVTTFTADGVTGYNTSGGAVTGAFDEYSFQGSGESPYGITVSGGRHKIALTDVHIVSSNIRQLLKTHTIIVRTSRIGRFKKISIRSGF